MTSALIVFDLDGTLVDSKRDLAESANQLIAELGGVPLSEEAIGLMIGGGAARLVRRALMAAGISDVPGGPPGALSRFTEVYGSRLLRNTRLYDGVPDAVRMAREHARVAVLTNKARDPSERILEGLGVRELFDDVVGGDGPLPRKPDPAALLDLMRRAGASASRTLLVGDSTFDHQTAQRASSRCCMAAYGFGYATFAVEDLTGEEWIATDARELVGIIERFAAPVL
ncbi:MAG: HAD-IA family hydrolase [Acidobacteria bacterium]|nr:HAD-IA family hydrolase [Acidobacteriota bacterium]